MLQKKSQSSARRGRIFPDIQWTEEQWEQWRTETEAFRQQCLPIFEQVKKQYLDTHYGWYVAVEPDSGDYFIAQQEMEVIQDAQEKHPLTKVFIFKINETGVAGTI